MRHLADTLARLRQFRSLSAWQPQGGEPTTHLQELTGFGSNPGQLTAFTHVPAGLAANAPLVVVLHGCTQTAAGYDHAAGWSALADEAGFTVLLPEQMPGNNPNRCFNWFAPGDIRRGSGEALSIRQMIAAMVRQHGLNPDRVYINGLSAGGGMTAAMLATYPEVFAGGAVIAGLPFGVAETVPQAFDRMRGHGLPDARNLETLARKASGDFQGPWPSLSIWHGSADVTVAASNADALVQQWHGLVGVPLHSAEETQTGTVTHRVWRDQAGTVRLEDYRIAGMGHGTPLAIAEGCGQAAPYMLDAGICSTRRIAAFWGLLGTPVSTAPAAERPKARAPEIKSIALPQPEQVPQEPVHADQIDILAAVTRCARNATGHYHSAEGASGS